MDDLDFTSFFAQLSDGELAAVQVAAARAVAAQRSGVVCDSRLALLDLACGADDACTARGLRVIDGRAPCCVEGRPGPCVA